MDRNHITNDRPLEIVSGNVGDLEALKHKAEQGRKRGALGCIIPLLLIAFLAIYCLGWITGLNAS